MALSCVFKQGGLFQTQAVNGLLEVVILLANIVQIDVIPPQVLYAEFGGMDQLFRRGNDRVGPKAD